MGIFVGWVLLAILIGGIGQSRKIGFMAAFFLSLILSPIIGIFITLASQTIEDAEFKKKTIEFQKESPPNFQNETDIIEKIVQLAELKEKGILTEEEFNIQKQRLLAQ
jgi:hypothetical protein